MDEATFLSEIALSDGGMDLIDDNTPATLRQCSAPTMEQSSCGLQPDSKTFTPIKPQEIKLHHEIGINEFEQFLDQYMRDHNTMFRSNTNLGRSYPRQDGCTSVLALLNPPAG